MTARARVYEFLVREQISLSADLTRVVLANQSTEPFPSSPGLDEWVGVVVPGQFQSRYYTVRRREGEELTLDIAMHAQGLVSDWARQDCRGSVVSISEPKGAYGPPADAQWVVAIGDLTGLPAVANICEQEGRPSIGIVEASAPIEGYCSQELDWINPPEPGGSGLAEFVVNQQWPDGAGYVWFAGESAQMRVVRSHLLRTLAWPAARFHTMGYWRAVAERQLRAVDPRREKL